MQNGEGITGGGKGEGQSTFRYDLSGGGGGEEHREKRGLLRLNCFMEFIAIGTREREKKGNRVNI